MTLNTNQRHIQAVLDLATTQDWSEGKAWYATAHEAAQHISTLYSITTATAAGVIAALSPRNKWARNLNDAEQLISTFVAAGPEAAEAIKVCTFTSNKRKALAILDQLEQAYDAARKQQLPVPQAAMATLEKTPSDSS